MKKTILLVDDDASIRESVKKVLQDAGYEVVLAAGGLEAIAKFEAQSFELVMLDIGLPNQNSWETCRHIAREHGHVPIIVITGQTEQYKSALAAGAAALMEKPLDAPRLLHMIKELLSQPMELKPSRSKKVFYHVSA